MAFVDRRSRLEHMVAADVSICTNLIFIYFIVSGMPALKTGYSRLLLVVITSVAVIGTHLFPLFDQIFSP
jgi:putative copper export protein